MTFPFGDDRVGPVSPIEPNANMFDLAP